MSDAPDYIGDFKIVCTQANNSPFDPKLATSSPGKRVNDKFHIRYGVGGLCTLVVDPTLYNELESSLQPLMRKELRREMVAGRLQIMFCPVANAQLQ